MSDLAVAERDVGILAQCAAQEAGVHDLDLSQQSQWLDAVFPEALSQCSIDMPASTCALATATPTGETASVKLMIMAKMKRNADTLMQISFPAMMGRTA